MSTEIIETKVICSRPGQMYGWPGITKAANGDILVAASERKFHMCPFGREIIIRSKDNGKTWSLPEEIYNSELDDRDANLLRLDDDTIILSWFSSTAFEELWPERFKSFSTKSIKKLTGTWMIKSFDNGLTWEREKSKLPVGMHISPVQLSDKSLITIGPKNPKDSLSMSVYKSDDLGVNWYKTCEIDGYPVLNENHIIETEPGCLLALIRSRDFLHKSISKDYGKTWSKPEATQIWGFPAQMLKLNDGRILCTYSRRKHPYSIEAVLSNDNGETWDTDNTIILYSFEDEPDMGYPSSIELNENEIFTVFYVSRRDVNLPESHLKHHPQIIGYSPEGIISVHFKI